MEVVLLNRKRQRARQSIGEFDQENRKIDAWVGVEFVNRRAARLKSGDTDSPIWRHRKTPEHHLPIEASYVPQSQQGPLEIVSPTSSNSQFRPEQDAS